MKLQTKAERRGALATYWQKHSKIENHNVKCADGKDVMKSFPCGNHMSMMDVLDLDSISDLQENMSCVDNSSIKMERLIAFLKQGQTIVDELFPVELQAVTDDGNLNDEFEEVFLLENEIVTGRMNSHVDTKPVLFDNFCESESDDDI